MAQTQRILLPYIPTSLLDGLLHAPPKLWSRAPVVSSLEAAVLFADLSGFTPLTEALAEHGDEGPEEITRLLDQTFHRLIVVAEAQGGDTVKFSGDAITVVFPAQAEPLALALRRAHQAGVAMQAVMAELNPLSSRVGPVDLGLKVGIGGGEVLAMQLGGMYQHWEYVVAGEGLRQAARAEGQASRGEICLSPEAQASIHPEAIEPQPLPREALLEAASHHAKAPLLRRFVPDVVLSWAAQEDLHQWLGVLRSMCVLFIGIEGFEQLHHSEREKIHRLHRLMQRIQKQVSQLQGHINKLAVDDKGAILLAMFGAPPYAHVDDPLRGVQCALALQQMAAEEGVALRIGVTTGRVFAGPVGGEVRREYAVLGDAVNLAARLMAYAGPPGVLVDRESYRLTLNQVQYEALDPVKLKGKSQPLPVYRPLGLSDDLAQESQDLPLLGREYELSRLLQHAQTLSHSRSRAVLLKGDAGMGKSRLVAALLDPLRRAGHRIYQSKGRSARQQNSLGLWRTIFKQLLGPPPSEGSWEDHIEALVAAHAPQELPRLPLLNDFLGLSFAQTPLLEDLDHSLRHESLHQLLLQLLKQIGGSCCLVLENVHWLDSLSWELLQGLLRSMDMEDRGIFVLLTLSPESPDRNREALEAIEELVYHEHLEPLSPEAILAITASLLGLPISALPEELCSLVQRRAEGNPFFAEELVHLLRERGWIQLEDRDGHPHCSLRQGHQKAAIPDSLEGLLLARIDRLPPSLQLTLRVASVLGRSFPLPLLNHALQAHTPVAEHALLEHLASLKEEAFLVEEKKQPPRYTFKSGVIQAVAYGTLLHEHRRKLHRTVAESLVGTYHSDAQGQSHLLPRLVEHWRFAEERDQERRFARLAGEHASRQYANAEAIHFLSRALELAEDPDERFELLLSREQVLATLGQREAQRQDIAELTRLVSHTEGHSSFEVSLRSLNYALTTHAYGEVLQRAPQVVAQARTEERWETAAQALRMWGRALHEQGERQAAKDRLEEALALARRAQATLEEAVCLRHLGTCHQYLNDFPAAIACIERALELTQTHGHRLDEAGLLNNMGLLIIEIDALDEAVIYFRRSWELFQSLGSRRGICVSQSNLGYYLLQCGEYTEALKALEQVLRQSREIDDKGTQSYTLNALGECYLQLGLFEKSQEICQQALELSRQIGHPFFEGYALIIQAGATYALGQYDRCAGILEGARVIGEQIGEREFLAHAAFLQGRLCEARGETDASQEAFAQAAQLFEDIGRRSERLAALAGLAHIQLKRGQPKAALELLQPLFDPQQKAHLRYAKERFWIEKICLRVLHENQHPDLPKRLHRATELLRQRADKIEGEELRRCFLAIPAHQQLLDPSSTPAEAQPDF